MEYQLFVINQVLFICIEPELAHTNIDQVSCASGLKESTNLEFGQDQCSCASF